MKILVVSAYYPPHYLGGYELGCGDVVNRLREKGHEVLVLTSDFRLAGNVLPEEAGVRRLLCLNSPRRPLHKTVECRKFLRTVKEFAPDLIYFWSQSGLCYWLPFVARVRRHPTAFFLSDPSFVAWRIGSWFTRWERGDGIFSRAVRGLFGNSFLMLGWPITRHQSCHFASEFLAKVAQENHIPIAARTSRVVHWGIDLARFATAPRRDGPPTRLLFVGRLSPQKGVHTAIGALRLLAQEKRFEGLTLTLAGGGPDQEYARKMHELPGQYGIAERVHFLGELPRAKLKDIYAQHDILVFPSEWEEPFAITPLEAVAAGLVVVGTTTGGSGELFRNRETAMTFAAGDAADCARAIRELSADRSLYDAIRSRASHQVATHHTLEVMVDAIESGLRRIIAGSPISH